MTIVQRLPLSIFFACFVIVDCCHIEVFKEINAIQSGNANKYQHNASSDKLKGITGISDRRAQKIIKIRDEKWSPLTLEDLKLMPDIPNTMWDPLIQNGEVTLERRSDRVNVK